MSHQFPSSPWLHRTLTLSLAYVVVLDLLYYLSSRTETQLLWGINYWSSYPEALRLLFFLSPLAFAAVGLMFGRSPSTVSEEGRKRKGPGPQARPRKRRTSERRGVPIWAVVFTVFPAALLFWLLRDGTHLWGDGLLIMAESRRGTPFSETAPLANRLYLWTASIFGEGGLGLERTLALTSVVLGVAYVAVAWFLWRELLTVENGEVNSATSGPRAPASHDLWMAFLLFLLQPSLLWFCGYIEFYAAAATMALVNMLLGLWCLRGRAPAWLFFAVWTISVGVHVFLVLYLPFVIAVLLEKRASTGEESSSWHGALLGSRWGRAVQLAAGIVLGGGVLALIGPGPREFIKGLLGRGGGGILRLRVADSMTQAYGVLDGGHFLDLLNEVLLVMPLLLVIPFWIVARREEFRRRRSQLLGMTAALALLPTLLGNPRLGMARDWDLMALASVPVNLLVIHLVVSGGGRRGVVRGGDSLLKAFVFLLFGLGMARTGSWIYLHHHVEMAEERARAVAAEERLNSPFARSHFHEDLALHLEKRGRVAEALVEARMASELRPDHARLAYNLGNVAFHNRDFETAREAFARACRLDSTFVDAVNNLGVALRALGDLEEAEIVFRRACRLTPGDPFPHANLALILLERDDIEGSLELARKMRTMPLDSRSRSALEVLAQALERRGLTSRAEEVRRIAAERGGASRFR